MIFTSDVDSVHNKVKTLQKLDTVDPIDSSLKIDHPSLNANDSLSKFNDLMPKVDFAFINSYNQIVKNSILTEKMGSMKQRIEPLI